jgi:PPOX class F420-dependent enzyme/OxyR family protein
MKDIFKQYVTPVGFDFDGDYIYVGGMNILKSTKYKNVLKNNKVAIVVDDLKSVEPWEPRGNKVYGTADVVSAKEDTWIQLIMPILVISGLKRSGVGELTNQYL